MAQSLSLHAVLGVPSPRALSPAGHQETGLAVGEAGRLSVCLHAREGGEHRSDERAAVAHLGGADPQIPLSAQAIRRIPYVPRSPPIRRGGALGSNDHLVGVKLKDAVRTTLGERRYRLPDEGLR